MTATIYDTQQSHAQPDHWLIHRRMLDRLLARAGRYARGRLAEIGCGDELRASVFAPFVEQHVGVAPGGGPGADVIADAYDTTLATAWADTVLMTEVLEHLEDPVRPAAELWRITAPGAHLLLTVPMTWHVHEAPPDFYRFTEYGLRHVSAEGFDIVELVPIGGFVTTFTLLGSYDTRPLRRWHSVRAAQWAAQRLAYRYNDRDPSTQFACLWAMVARRGE